MTKVIRGLFVASIMVVLAACAASAGSPGVGVWDVNLSTPLGDQPGTWTINADGTGVMGGDQGEQAISGIALDGNTIVFDVDIDAGGQSLSLSFSGTVEGDELTGQFESDFGPFGVTGTRQ